MSAHVSESQAANGDDPAPPAQSGLNAAGLYGLEVQVRCSPGLESRFHTPMNGTSYMRSQRCFNMSNCRVKASRSGATVSRWPGLVSFTIAGSLLASPTSGP